MDILEFHHIISKNFNAEIAMSDDYLLYKTNLQHSLKLPYLSQRVRNAIEDDLLTVENKLKIIESMKFYFIEVCDIVNRYVECISKPVVNSFFTNNRFTQNEKLNIVKEFWAILNMYKQHYFFGSTSVENLNCSVCDFCKSDYGFILDDVAVVCYKCFSENVQYVPFQNNNEFSYKTQNKYIYDRNSQFRDCMIRFQGKQKLVLPEAMLKSLNDSFQSYRIKNISYCNIATMLRNLGYSKYVDDYILIHHMITGEPTPDISNIEEQLLQEFDMFNIELKSFEHLNKKNFIIQYILFQLLKHHGIHIHADHLMIIKSNERKIFTNRICKIIFKNLGWNFLSLL
jgi:hypothetical protein